MRILLIACAVTAAAVRMASAQEPVATASWAPEIGGEVRVTRHNGVKTTGQFRSLDADTVRLLVEDQEVVMARDTVARIERRGDSVLNGFIIGAVIGIPFAALGTGEVEGTANRAFAFIGGVGLYGLIGAGIDATHKGWTTVYKAGTVPTTTRRRQVWMRPTADGMRVGYNRRF